MEQVLTIRTERLGDIVSRSGLITGHENEVMDLISKEGIFLPRELAEVSPEYRQIIPYVTVVRGNEAFVTRRLEKGGESRLHGLLSLGIGGHINESDHTDGAWLMNCLRRELDEEIDIPDFGTLTLRGLINDNGNDVGSVHLGFFFTLSTAGDVAVRETEKLEGSFRPITGLAAETDRMETWSRILLPELVSLWTAGKL